MTQTEALKLALEALEKTIRYASFHGADWAFNEIEEAITAIKAALEAHKALSTECVAQPEQSTTCGEPVAWDGDCVLGHCGSPAGCEASNCCRADPTAPPQHSANARKPLTDEQIYLITGVENRDEMMHRMARNIARAIEAAHGIKENT